MRPRLYFILIFAFLLPEETVVAQAHWSLELGGGVVWNAKTRLTIEQDGEPDIRLTADYETRPFGDPWYYLIRVTRSKDSSAWELQFLHHKLYLKNTTDEVEHFEISHGYNIFTLNRAFLSLPVTLRIGGGIVLAHTESKVRGKEYKGNNGGIFGSGYRITGPVVIAGGSRPLWLSSRWFVTPEIQVSAAWARVPVADGDATAPNVAAHFLIGAGYRF
jgi:hypothetical protein